MFFQYEIYYIYICIYKLFDFIFFNFLLYKVLRHCTRTFIITIFGLINDSPKHLFMLFLFQARFNDFGC